MKKNLDAYEGQDKIVGRPIRLNKVDLKVKPGKDYAQLLFWGDVHLGHPQCLIEKAREYLTWALKKGVYVLLMGDLLESGMRDSVGDSVYQQNLNPQDQMEQMVEILLPLAKANLIIGMHTGNHEHRITKATGIDVAKVMARLLCVKYLGYSCWSQVHVGSQIYSAYTTHGASGARFKHTKMKAVMDLTQWIDADIIAMGHVHSEAAEAVIKQSVSHGRVVERKCYTVLTGSFIGWDRSYAQMMNMPITRIGAPTAKLFSKRKDVHFSL